MNPRTRRALTFWSEQDWTLSNLAIAATTQRNRTTVTHWRKRLEKPNGPRGKRSGPSVSEIQTRFPGLTGMTYREAGAKFNMSPSTARTYAKRLGEGERKMGRPRKVKV